MRAWQLSLTSYDLSSSMAFSAFVSVTTPTVAAGQQSAIFHSDWHAVHQCCRQLPRSHPEMVSEPITTLPP